MLVALRLTPRPEMVAGAAAAATVMVPLSVMETVPPAATTGPLMMRFGVLVSWNPPVVAVKPASEPT